jgi:hypothetical protein
MFVNSCGVLISLCLLFIICSASKSLNFGASQAAKLISDSLQAAEKSQGLQYGKTKGSAQDTYSSTLGGQVKTYRPDVFKFLRHCSGVSDSSWLACMNAANLVQLNADSKSGQAFWRSQDGVLVLKTIKPYECRNLREVLEKLSCHVSMENEHSCIGGVLGLFRVRLSNGKKFYVMASKNVYPSSFWPQSESRKYDLKGSTVGRKKSISSNVYKDLDLLADNRYLMLGNLKPVVLHSLQRDAQFLSSCGFMDYSLLVDVEYVPVGFLRKAVAKLWNPFTGIFPSR